MALHSFIAVKTSRLDESMAEILNISRSQAQKYIKQGVTVDGVATTKNGFIVKPLQEVIYAPLVRREEEEPDLDILPYRVIFEDADLLVIDKPRGLVVHPAAGHSKDTLINYLLYHYKSIAELAVGERSNRPGIVHRIDKDTSGLLVVAKTPKAFVSLGDQVSLHMINREYLCIVHGVPAHQRFKVEAAIGRDPKDRKKMAVVPDEYGRPAITHFRLLWTNGQYSVLQCVLETGRTHQIRVHLAYFNLPIVGDVFYGLASDNKKFLQGQLLHAYKLQFEHPINKKEVTFYASTDEYFRESLQKIATPNKSNRR